MYTQLDASNDSSVRLAFLAAKGEAVELRGKGIAGQRTEELGDGQQAGNTLLTSTRMLQLMRRYKVQDIPGLPVRRVPFNGCVILGGHKAVPCDER